MKSHPFEHGGNIYQASPAGGWLDFSANINPLGLSPRIRQAIAGGIDGIDQYPDPQGHQLKTALSHYYRIPCESIVLGNGAAELFYIWFHTFRPQRTLIPVPSFSEYERAAMAGGSRITFLQLRPEDGFAMPWKQLTAQCAAADCLIVGNPNNPTANLLARDDMERLVWQANQTATMVLIDESFLDFRVDREQYTAMPLVSSYDNVIVFQSLTKFYAIPGLRLGFAVVPPSLARQMEGHKDVWNVNSLAQAAGTAALQDRDWQERTRRFVTAEKDWLYQELSSIKGLRVYPPTVNFILWQVTEDNISMENVIKNLRRHRILVRSCANYPGLDDHYIRTAVRTHSENKMFLQVLLQTDI